MKLTFIVLDIEDESECTTSLITASQVSESKNCGMSVCDMSVPLALNLFIFILKWLLIKNVFV